MWRLTRTMVGAAVAATALLDATGALGQRTPSFIGIYNFRDVGGYTTADGRTVRSGVLYRSATLGDMTPADRDALLSLGIHSEVDLRCPDEMAEMPSRWAGARMKVTRPFLALCVPPRQQEPEVTEPGEGYAQAARLGASGLGKTFRDLSRSSEGTLIHCTGGADRTGLAVAILFRILGVSEEQIEHEYMLTNDYWSSAEGLRHADRILRGAPTPPGFPGMKPTTVRVMFATLDRQYGTFDRYVRDGLQLSQGDVRAIRRRLLAE
jgi:protein-tyrosine phosphatase